MTESLTEVKLSLVGAVADCDQFDCEPIGADAWVISSLLQKSIRRGEAETAKRAAHTFLSLKGSAIWRRPMVIAFEDVGVGSTDAVTAVVAASSDPAFRKACTATSELQFIWRASWLGRQRTPSRRR
jgi:replication-associated recombination protein RarA